MKRPKKGPEIDLSKLKPGNVKPPKALGDLYRELKTQHLLPIVALLIVGLIAVPMLIGGSSDRPAAPARQGKIKSSTSDQVALRVSKWTPGLLDYKKTLRGAKAIDPFAPRVADVDEDEASEREVQPAAEPAEIEVPTGGGGEPSPVETPGSTSGGASNSQGESKDGGSADSSEDENAVTIDVQVTAVHEDGGVDQNPVRRNLPKLTKLPSEALPALTYVGPSDDGAKAMMSVSSEVTAMVGDSNCIVPAKPCSLLALKVGAPETIVYGTNGLTFRVELVRIGDESNSPGEAKRNHPAPGHESGSGAAPAPRQANALIGVGGGHVVSGISAWAYGSR